MSTVTAPALHRVGRAVLRGLPDLRPARGAARTAGSAEDAVARGVAIARVYAYASVDYPGAAQSLVFDSDGTTAVGAFIFDPASGSSPTTAFTFADGIYQILAVPGSSLSIATGINGAGLMIGVLRRPRRRGSWLYHAMAVRSAPIDFPGATTTQAIGVNEAGQIVGDYFDAASTEHGFVSSGGVFTAINFPGATGNGGRPTSTLPATSSASGRMRRARAGFSSRAACSRRSPSRSPRARAPSASTTPGDRRLLR